MGTTEGATPAVRLSAPGAKPLGGRRAVEQSRVGRCLAVKNGPWKIDGADLLARAAGETGETAGSGAGCRARAGGGAGADRGELGGQSKELKILSTTVLLGTSA